MKKGSLLPNHPFSELPAELQYENYRIKSEMVQKRRRQVVSGRIMSFEYLEVYYFASYHFSAN